MTFLGNRNFALEVSLGHVPGYARAGQFGVATDCDSAVVTDVWDGADGVTATKIWVPPTVARIHDIVSTSALDAGPAGTGARTLLVRGLTDWGTPEVTEVITMNGTTIVPTVNAYVTINRLTCIPPFGTLKTNVGNITATAQTDGTITAAALSGNGSSLMAIYGLPSTQTIAVTSISTGLLAGGGGANIVISLVVDFAPDQTDSGFIFHGALVDSNQYEVNRLANPPLAIPGPALIKIQAESDTNNIPVAASFNSYLVDN